MIPYLLEQIKPVKALASPETDRNGSALEGDWICLKGYSAVLIVAHAGGLGANLVLQVEQATSDGGTQKDISGKTVTFTNGTDENALKTIHVHRSELDISNGYDWIRIQADDPGGALTYCDIIYVLGGPDYSGSTMVDPTV